MLGWNQFQVACKNEKCKQHNLVKNVSLPIVSNYIYLVGSLRCGECHQTPEFLEKEIACDAGDADTASQSGSSSETTTP